MTKSTARKSPWKKDSLIHIHLSPINSGTEMIIRNFVILDDELTVTPLLSRKEEHACLSLPSCKSAKSVGFPVRE